MANSGSKGVPEPFTPITSPWQVNGILDLDPDDDSDINVRLGVGGSGEGEIRLKDPTGAADKIKLTGSTEPTVDLTGATSTLSVSTGASHGLFDSGSTMAVQFDDVSNFVEFVTTGALGGRLRLDDGGKITTGAILQAATGNEVHTSLTPTVNKATSGNYTVLESDTTETAAPGTDNRFFDFKVGGTSRLLAQSDGAIRMNKVLASSSKASRVEARSTDLTITDAFDHHITLMDASGANRAVNLPAASAASTTTPSGLTVGALYGVKKTDSSANTVTINPDGSDTIDDAASKVLDAEDEFLLIVSDGVSKWHVFGETGGTPDPIVPADGRQNITGDFAISGTYFSEVADGASAVGFISDTDNSLVTSGARLWSFRNNGTEELAIDKTGIIIGSPFIEVQQGATSSTVMQWKELDGNVKMNLNISGGNPTLNFFGDPQTLSGRIQAGNATTGFYTFEAVLGGTGTQIKSTRNNSSPSAAILLINAPVLSILGSDLIRLRNGNSGQENWRIDYDGSSIHEPARFSVVNDAQNHRITVMRQTTDATVTELTRTGAAPDANKRITLEDDSGYAFRVLVVGRRSDADDETAGYILEGVIDRNTGAATTALVGTVSKTVLAEDTAAWDANAVADATNGSLNIEVTGEASKTINWLAHVRLTKVTG